MQTALQATLLWTADGLGLVCAQKLVAVVLRAELVALLRPQMVAMGAQGKRPTRVTRRPVQVQFVGVPEPELFLLGVVFGSRRHAMTCHVYVGINCQVL